MLVSFVLGIAASMAACAEGTNNSGNNTGGGTTSTSGTGATAATGGGGTAGNAGSTTGGSSGSTGGSGGGGATSTGGKGGTGGAGGGGGLVGGGGSAGCLPDEKMCFNICVPADDPMFGCDDPACSPCGDAHGLAGCVGGVCALLKCDAEWADCNGDASDGCEVHLPFDPDNCGACGVACVTPHGTAACESSFCVIGSCDAPWSDCNGTVADGCEANVQVDPENCATCATACAPGEQCQGAMCGVFCPPGKANCDGDAVNGCEVDLGTVSNCDFCGDACDLSNASADCQAGACVIVSCGAGFADCDGNAANGCEANLDGSANTCGGCGIVCPSGPNSTAVCTMGACELVCAGGYANCNNDPNDGCEQPILTDPSNCGGCNTVCVTPNATPGCAAGVCKIATCNPTFADCDQVVANGCEVNLNTDPTHCGGCNTLCNTPAHASSTCTAGACGYTCDAGFADCDGLEANGCEVNLNTDPTHCGSCAGACNLANAAQGCVAGSCTIASCNAGFANCDGLTPNGCEINLNTDPTHCGTCATSCNLPNSSQSCVGGMCAVGTCSAPFADCDGLAANGCETNTDSSIPNCGACNQACTIANGSPACAAGQCLVASCNAGFANCNNVPGDGCEINLNTNVGNCGSCGNTCDLANAAESCVGGACAIATCDPNFANCDNQTPNGCEINLDTNVAHCGSCATACNLANASQACNAGSCAIASCNAGFGNCDNQTPNGCETNLNSSVGNCGSCGNACSFPNAGAGCSNGACALGSCNAGFGNCDAQAPNGCETNLNTSLANCGSCGNACNLANASATCTAGSCQVATCTAPFADCDNSPANGCEVNLQTSVTHCGSCGNACNLANATAACTAGACAIASCNAGFADCDGDPANGCEINTNTSLGNCGACGSVCSPANASGSCVAGACQVASCDAGFANCNNLPADGCEIELATSLSNCGSCGNVCNLANSAEACVAGACSIASCDGGFGNCNNQTPDGCEINLTNNVANCGSCGNACNLANASQSCVGGSCAIGSCNAGFGDCNNQTPDGCETNLNASVGNCGSCGNVCSFPNAGAGCSNGSCALGTCDTGFGNCDNQAPNGCEVNLNISVAHCGSCGNACNLANASSTCTGGTCQVASCTLPFANCDNSPANGCEVNLNTSVNNCGTCGNICNLPNATPQCSGGTCAIASCNAGFADCDGNPANGCEVNITNSVGNCGVCGNICNTPNGTPACVAGACQVASCNSGFSNCNGLPVDGCEVNTNTSIGNCGGCGQICAPANSTGLCSAGTCTIGSCNSGFSNCNGAQGDGCEINLQADVQNCGTCGNNCAVTCSGHTNLTACSAGACTIQSCQPGFFNVDGACSGGCECGASSVSQSCATPASLGTLAVGAAPITTSANLVPAGVEAWYTVSFTGNTNASYHPHVKFTVNPGNQFKFDIRSNCAGGTLTCGVEGGVSNGVTDWETFSGAGSPGYYDAIPPVGNNGTILIHVYRVAGQPLSCSQFTLQVSN